MKLTEFIGITTRNMHVKFEAVRRSYNFWWKNAKEAGPSKQDEILTFSQCSPKFMKLTKFIGNTTRNMHVKFEAVWRSYNFWQKNAYSAGPSKQDEILRFSQCSPKFMKLTEFFGITTRNMHVKFEAVRRSYNFWHKNAYSAGPLKQDEIYTLSQWFSKIHETYRSYWNHHQKHACEIWGGSEKLQFLWKNAYSAGPSKQDEIWDFLNVLQNSWHLQNLLESPPETCMWILRQFGEATFFDGKCRQRWTFKTGWNFDIFSMFSKIHETYRSYWNDHQKHACEIWGSSEKLQFLT